MYFSLNLQRCFTRANRTVQIVARNYSVPAKQASVTSTFVGALRKIVGDQNVSTSDAVRDQHGHDESHHPSSLPDVVVFAESVDHVSQVAKFCNDNRVPLIPFGSGTGLEGGVNALQGGVSLDMNKMNKIVELNSQDFDCTVEPGVMRVALNTFLRDTGLWFPIDPGADASVCGMCATSASGTNAVRYGTMRENVLNLQVVLPDGRVFDTAGKGRRTKIMARRTAKHLTDHLSVFEVGYPMQKGYIARRLLVDGCSVSVVFNEIQSVVQEAESNKKTSAGYNLTNLFVGSEGTLGVITQATIRLYGIPEKTIAAVCHFNSVQEAVDTVVQILQCGIPMAKLEFLDDVAINAFNKYSKYNMTVANSLFLEFHGPSQGLEDQFDAVKDLVEANNGFGLQVASDVDERNRLWKARHEMVYACTALIPGSKPYSTDVCVPISNLPDVIVKTKEMISEAGVQGPIVGHVGDGNFHVFFPIDHTDRETLNKVTDIAKRMALLGLSVNGTCTGEHGIGLGKRELLIKELGEHGVEVMKQVKQAFDPNGIMNPGKVFV